MKKINVLFICSLNRVRSLTAQSLFEKDSQLNVKSAGTQINARVVVRQSLLSWADIIFVMEQEHEEKIRKKFPNTIDGKKIACLDIGNGYEYMDPDLIEILQREVPIHLPH